MNVSNKIKGFVLKYPKMSSLGFALITPTVIVGSVNAFKLLTHMEHIGTIASNIAMTMICASFIGGFINILSEAISGMDGNDAYTPLKNLMRKSIKKNLNESIQKYNKKVFQLDKDDVIPYEQKNLTYHLNELTELFHKTIYTNEYIEESSLNELRELSKNKDEVSQKKWNYYKNFAKEYLVSFPIISSAINGNIRNENVALLFELMDKKLTNEDRKILNGKKDNRNRSYNYMLEYGNVEFFNQLPNSLKKYILNDTHLSKDRHNELNKQYNEARSINNKNIEKKEDVFFENKKENFINYETNESNKYLAYLKEEGYENHFKNNSNKIKMILNIKEATLAILSENNISLIEEELFLKSDIDKFFLHLADEVKLFNKIERIERAKGKSETDLSEKKHELLNNHAQIIDQLAQKVLEVSNTIENKLTQDLESKKEVNRQFLSQKLG
jgi:hypothetical protein